MNANTASSSHPKNENNSQKSSNNTDQENSPDPTNITDKIRESSQSAIKEIKGKSAAIKENVKSYVQAHPFKCLAYVAISTFIFSKFF